MKLSLEEATKVLEAVKEPGRREHTILELIVEELSPISQDAYFEKQEKMGHEYPHYEEAMKIMLEHLRYCVDMEKGLMGAAARKHFGLKPFNEVYIEILGEKE